MELETRHRHIQKNIESLCRWSPPSNVCESSRTNTKRARAHRTGV
jgi:hypothetical protein